MSYDYIGIPSDTTTPTMLSVTPSSAAVPNHNVGDTLNGTYTVTHIVWGPDGVSYECSRRGYDTVYTISRFSCRSMATEEDKEAYEERKRKTLWSYSTTSSNVVDWFEIQDAARRSCYVVQESATDRFMEPLTSIAVPDAVARVGPAGSRCTVTRIGDTHLEIDAPPVEFARNNRFIAIVFATVIIVFFIGMSLFMAIWAGTRIGALAVVYCIPEVFAFLILLIIIRITIAYFFAHERWVISADTFTIPNPMDLSCLEGICLKQVYGNPKHLYRAEIETRAHSNQAGHTRHFTTTAVLYEGADVEHELPASKRPEQQWLVDEINAVLSYIKNEHQDYY